MERTPGKMVIPFLPLALDEVTMASSNRAASLCYWQTCITRESTEACGIAHLELGFTGNSAVLPQIVTSPNTMRTYCGRSDRVACNQKIPLVITHCSGFF